MSTLVFLGDLPFNRMIGGEFFKAKMGPDFTVCPVTSLLTFKHYQTLLPAEAEFVVVGCLGAFLAELRTLKMDKRDLALSKRTRPDFAVAFASFQLVDHWPSYLFFQKR